MILLDENLKIIHDGTEQPSEGIRKSLIQNNAVCFYAGEDTLYHFCADGSLALYFIAKPKFRAVTLSPYDLAFFRKERRVATAAAVVRDIGCERSMVYLEDCSFSVPTELLFR